MNKFNFITAGTWFILAILGLFQHDHQYVIACMAASVGWFAFGMSNL